MTYAMEGSGKMTNQKSNVHCHVAFVDSPAEHIEEMHKAISDVSWINNLGPCDQRIFNALSKRTVEKLVLLFKSGSGAVTSEIGEYVVSFSAKKALAGVYSLGPIPLAELIKEKISGNPGFDYHAEKNRAVVIFGEAKFSSTKNPYTDALSQIIEFIDLEKDVAEMAVLQKFVSKKAVDNVVNGVKGYAAAFSINSNDHSEIINNAKNSEEVNKLSAYDAIYLIGVVINDK